MAENKFFLGCKIEKSRDDFYNRPINIEPTYNKYIAPLTSLTFEEAMERIKDKEFKNGRQLLDFLTIEAKKHAI